MDSYIAVLGRQPDLAIAELESLYGGQDVSVVAPSIVKLSIASCAIDYRRLGGVKKLCKVLATLDTSEWQAVTRFLLQNAPSQSDKMPPGKMYLGLSVHGWSLTSSQITAFGLALKKSIHDRSGRPVRLIPNKTSELNTAQVLHNKLTEIHGWEIVIIRATNEKVIIAQTIAVQDIEDYTIRDRLRPKRDARVGMLPPKLAQIIINLAVGQLESKSALQFSNLNNCTSEESLEDQRNERRHTTVLDPFCGTGVVLQEALLMNYQVYGTDLDPRMVNYTRTNLAWLAQRYRLPTDSRITVADATNATWQKPYDGIASETYLGRPFTSLPPSAVLSETINDCNLILKRFLRNLHPQLNPGFRMCIAVPAWQVKRGDFRFLPLIDHLSDMGYNQVRFERVRNSQLLYYRAEQIVARQLLIITRN